MWETPVQLLGQEDLLEKGYPLQYSWASLVAQLVESACNAGDLGSIPGLGKSPGEGKGYPLQYSGLENSIVHWVTKSRTQQTDFPFHFGGLELAPQEGQEKGTPGEAGAQHVQRCWGTLPGPPGMLT